MTHKKVLWLLSNDQEELPEWWPKPPPVPQESTAPIVRGHDEYAGALDDAVPDFGMSTERPREPMDVAVSRYLSDGSIMRVFAHLRRLGCTTETLYVGHELFTELHRYASFRAPRGHDFQVLGIPRGVVLVSSDGLQGSMVEARGREFTARVDLNLLTVSLTGGGTGSVIGP